MVTGCHNDFIIPAGVTCIQIAKEHFNSSVYLGECMYYTQCAVGVSLSDPTLMVCLVLVAMFVVPYVRSGFVVHPCGGRLSYACTYTRHKNGAS